MGTPARLTRDGVEALLAELSTRFVTQPTIRRVIISVLEPLSEGWANSGQGMTGESLRDLEAALLSPLETLRTVDPAQALMATDQLSIAWERVRGKIEWTG